MTQAILNLPDLPNFLKFNLEHQKQAHRKEALWICSNIAGGTRVQIQFLFDHKLIDLALDSIICSSDIAKEALWIVNNVGAGGSSEQVGRLLQANVLESIFNRIEDGLVNDEDSKAVAVCLDALQNLLQRVPEISDVTGGEEVAESATAFLVDSIERSGIFLEVARKWPQLNATATTVRHHPVLESVLIDDGSDEVM
eukprot:TRINITY_DN10778_c0_g1_i5.p1 TRINITY_DN10778_c0_g1~~TRINITY_DN10778_c0_g1_i5.p1  ORF type:complete len:223 (+),score=32.60 TRINITY_DN10778_c0_g1_i5:81-671(+)